MAIEITHSPDGDHGRYHLLVDGEEVGELDHRDVEGRRIFTHTGVRAAFEGRGLAAQLVRRGVEDARAAGLEPVGQCSYVESYLAREQAS